MSLFVCLEEDLAGGDDLDLLFTPLDGTSNYGFRCRCSNCLGEGEVEKIHPELLSLIMMVVVMEITYLVMMMLMLTYLEAMMTMMTMMIAKAITAMNMISKLSIISITSLEVTKWKWKKEVKLSNHVLYIWRVNQNMLDLISSRNQELVKRKEHK